MEATVTDGNELAFFANPVVLSGYQLCVVNSQRKRYEVRGLERRIPDENFDLRQFAIRVDSHDVIAVTDVEMFAIQINASQCGSILNKSHLGFFVLQIEPNTLVSLNQFFNLAHSSLLVEYGSPKRASKNTHRYRWVFTAYHKPIGQALAPYHTAGCCAVNELVSHALFIG